MRKLIACICMLFSCSTFAAPSFQQMVYFGDSLTDNGNLYRMLKIIPTSPPYYEGRFTNGPTWAENVGDHYKQLNIDTLNYCVGGATAILQSPKTDKYIPPVILEEEIYSYLKNSTTVDKTKVFYALWIGANDYLYGTDDVDAEAVTTRVVDKSVWALTTLINEGSTNILVLNLPDLGRIPYARANNKVNRLSNISRMHNMKLDIAVKSLKEKYPLVKITYIDIYQIFNDLLDHTDKYNKQYGINLTNTTDACWPGKFIVRSTQDSREKLLRSELDTAFAKMNISLNTKHLDKLSNIILSSPALAEAYAVGKAKENDEVPCANPDEYLFWDQMHPTAVIHRILGDMVVDTLQSNS